MPLSPYWHGETSLQSGAREYLRSCFLPQSSWVGLHRQSVVEVTVDALSNRMEVEMLVERLGTLPVKQRKPGLSLHLKVPPLTSSRTT